MAGIYFHIPFCKQACHYCDFHFSTNTKKQAELINRLGDEVKIQRDYLAGESIETIYFGGGTPSLLGGDDISYLLKVINDIFVVEPGAEVTLEANPDDLTQNKLVHFKKAGINRLSIGIQSFDDSILKFLNRAHNSELAISCFEDARNAGFSNISIDLMYALPGQDVSAWMKNIHQAMHLAPEHISAYSLTIEEKTVFGNWAAKNKIAAVDNDVSAQELMLLIDELEGAGYIHYEVSNFAKPGYMSKHNSSYWKGKKYLGIGPSAHSFNGISRQFNVSNNHDYLAALQNSQIPATIEVLTREDQINDWLLTTLRTSWGTDLEKLRNDYQFDLLKIHGNYIQKLVENGHAVLTSESLILTKSGRLLADKIASDLFSMTF